MYTKILIIFYLIHKNQTGHVAIARVKKFLIPGAKPNTNTANFNRPLAVSSSIY